MSSSDSPAHNPQSVPNEPRTDGERGVPMEIWQTTSFQQWYAAQRGAGNELVAASPERTFRTGNGLVFFWALHVSIWIADEQRVKDIDRGHDDMPCGRAVLGRTHRGRGRLAW